MIAKFLVTITLLACSLNVFAQGEFTLVSDEQESASIVQALKLAMTNQKITACDGIKEYDNDKKFPLTTPEFISATVEILVFRNTLHLIDRDNIYKSSTGDQNIYFFRSHNAIFTYLEPIEDVYVYTTKDGKALSAITIQKIKQVEKNVGTIAKPVLVSELVVASELTCHYQQ